MSFKRMLAHAGAVCAVVLGLGLGLGVGSAHADAVYADFYDAADTSTPVGHLEFVLAADGRITASLSYVGAIYFVGWDSPTTNYNSDFSVSGAFGLIGISGGPYGDYRSGVWADGLASELTWTIGLAGQFTSVYDLLTGGHSPYDFVLGGINDIYVADAQPLVGDVPEPASLALLGAALVAMGAVRRRGRSDRGAA